MHPWGTKISYRHNFIHYRQDSEKKGLQFHEEISSTWLVRFMKENYWISDSLFENFAISEQDITFICAFYLECLSTFCIAIFGQGKSDF